MFHFDRLIFIFVLLNFYDRVTAGDVLKDDNTIDNKRSDSGGIWFGPRLGKRALTFTEDDERTPFMRLLEAADALKYYYDQLQYGNYEVGDSGGKASKNFIFTPKLGRSLADDKGFDIDFRPRLGRRLTNEMGVTPADETYGWSGYRRGLRKDDKRYENVLFTPRVGKRLSDDDREVHKNDDKRRETLMFTPRVGRAQKNDFSAEDDLYRVEVDQGEKRTKYFSPRLGRTMNFSPRLGRELNYEAYPDRVRVVRSANKTNTT